ncbi:MAG: ABC transporter permease [Desulfobacterales bacterium]|nr:MAG: ABC transporter permease [Desulfobacterales bacterium]
MKDTLHMIPFANLLLAFIPISAVVGVLYLWSLKSRTALYAITRMLAQLMLIGYILTFIFESNRASIVIVVLSVMLLAASWISLRPVQSKRKAVYPKALASITIGGLTTLILITQGVLDLETWYQPDFVIPLAGMIFANSMNTVSLAAERLEAETQRGVLYVDARQVAFTASLIPLINSLFAVGLVSFPGMMTGQILSGVSPLVAARYQIMVMCMIFGSAGISAACYLILLKPKVEVLAAEWKGSGPA